MKLINKEEKKQILSKHTKFKKVKKTLIQELGYYLKKKIINGQFTIYFKI